MPTQYYMRAYNTSLSQFVDWIVDDQPDSTGIYSGYVVSDLENISVNRIVKSKIDNFLKPLISADGYYFHLNSYDWLNPFPPSPNNPGSLIPVPNRYVGIAVVRGTTNAIYPTPAARDYSTITWDEVEQRWKFAFNNAGSHTTLTTYIPINTGSITSDGYIAIGTNPAQSGIIRIPNDQYLVGRNVLNSADGYLIGLDNLNRIKLGSAVTNPVFVVGYLRVGSNAPASTDGYIRDGGTPSTATSFIRNSNATSIISFRNALDTANIVALSSNSSNNIIVGDAVNPQVSFNTATFGGSNLGIHQFQVNSSALVEIGSINGTPTTSPFVRFVNGTLAPSVYQVAATAATNGQTLTIQAQNASSGTANGGILQLTSGTGTGSGVHGSLDLQAGAVLKVRIFPTTASPTTDNNSILFHENLFRVDVAQLIPVIRQDSVTTTSAVGQAFTVQSQNSTGATSTGGLLNLTSGTGTTIAGVVNLQTGGTTKFTVSPTINTHANPIEQFNTSQLNPVIRQEVETGNGVTGDTLSLQAQNSTGTTTTGGALVLTSGTGTTIAGTVDVQTGTVSRMLVTAGSPVATSATALYTINSFQIVGGTSATTVPNPIFKHNDVTTNSATGQSFTVQAQNATGTTAIGGNLILGAGSGTSRDGYVKLQTAGVDRVLITQTQTVINGNLLVNGTTTSIASTVVELADRVIHVNSSANTFPGTTTAAPTSIAGVSVDRGSLSTTVKRNYYGLFWNESDGYWKFSVNTDGYTTEATLTDTLPVVSSGYLAQATSTITTAAVPTVGGFKALNNTTAVASRNAASTADLPLIGTDSTNHIVYGSGTDNAGHIFNTTAGTIYDFKVASVSTYTLTPVSSGATTLQAAATVTSLTYNQATTGSSTGAVTTIQAQNALTTGGALTLTSGTGVTAGNVIVQTGGVARLTVTPTTSLFADTATALTITPLSSGATTIQAASTVTSLTYNQATTGSATGAATTVQAQNALTTGGALTLTSGTGVTAGNVIIQTGGVARLTVTPTTALFADTATALTLTPVSSGATSLSFANTVTSAAFSIVSSVAAATGAPVTIQAQTTSAGASTGGAINLSVGTGVTTNGTINLQSAGSNAIRFVLASAGPTTMSWQNGTTVPAIQHDNSATVSGETFTVSAQGSAVSVGDGYTGGALLLKGGVQTGSSSTGTGGSVIVFPQRGVSVNGSIIFGCGVPTVNQVTPLSTTNAYLGYNVSGAVGVAANPSGIFSATFTNTITTVSFSQNSTSAGDGYAYSITAQPSTKTTGTVVGGALNLTAGSATGASTSNTGGNVVISSGVATGAGTNLDGYIKLFAGAIEQARVVPNKFNMMTGQRINISDVGSSPFTIVDGYYCIMVDTTSAPITINMPATPTRGDVYVIKDAKGTSATFNITVQGNGANIDVASSYLIAVNYASVTIAFNGTIWSVL